MSNRSSLAAIALTVWAFQFAPGLNSFAAENDAISAPDSGQKPDQNPAKKKPHSKRKAAAQAKGKRPSEKEDEGTEAPHRFEADSVIKSQYQLNGQPLEVDPD